MTAHHDLDRQLTDFLRDGPEELPYQSFDAVRDRTEQTRQRVGIGPWRLPEMNKIVTIGLGVAAVVILVFVGAQLFGTAPGGTGGPGTEPTASPEPTSSAASGPPLTQSFTSTLHGYSVSYPEGWTTLAATEPWTAETFPLSFEAPHADYLYDPTLTSDLFLTIASQPLGNSTPENWLTLQMTSDEGCGTATEPITVDGASGLGADGCSVAVITTADRGYWIQLYTGDAAPVTYDQAWFEEVLATIQLQPEDAVD